MPGTAFTRRVGCRVPVQLAGMPGVTTPELVAAVADAGGLGMLGATRLPPPALAAALDDLSRRTTGAVGVNFLMPFLDRECVPIAAARARVVEFFYGTPEPSLVELAHAGGALASWQVGSLDEARAAAAAGCDLIVAQGTEAGGHVRGRIGLLPLLAEVVDAVDVPVVAAGGIGTARAMAGALAAGAAAVRVGTRFVAAAESGAHPDYQGALVAARGEDTVLTEAFSVMWPHAPHRVLRSCVAAAEAFAGESTGTFRIGGQELPLPRFAVPSPLRDTTGAIGAMALYAGEDVGAVDRIEPAAAIVAALVSGAEALLARRGE
ncbi:MAG TPA: nitronate monooxygenase [Candidatus Binatia bacterium]|nr:nitronate monooxygenase [Candidatus Binatia bacterium]